MKYFFIILICISFFINGCSSFKNNDIVGKYHNIKKGKEFNKVTYIDIKPDKTFKYEYNFESLSINSKGIWKMNDQDNSIILKSYKSAPKVEESIDTNIQGIDFIIEKEKDIDIKLVDFVVRKKYNGYSISGNSNRRHSKLANIDEIELSFMVNNNYAFYIYKVVNKESNLFNIFIDKNFNVAYYKYINNEVWKLRRNKIIDKNTGKRIVFKKELHILQ